MAKIYRVEQPDWYYACNRGVISRNGVSEEIKQIRLPTLILVGEQDLATVPEKAERMHAAIAGSKLVTIQNAGHSSTIEKPQAVNEAIATFCEQVAHN